MSDELPPAVPHASPLARDSRRDVSSSIQAALGSAYIVERELGGGGMSRVFVATDTALARRVAVKVLSPELFQGVSAERFAREVAMAAQLQDPHIVPVLTTGATADGLPFYTMPFIEGESLRERMRRGAVPLEDAIRVLRDVAEALEYAHARGIVHRDIKPENVLLSGRNAVVADFGIAKAVSAARTAVPNGTLTSIGLSLGTPAYMAPEQAAGDSVDHRADLYSWGIMAWELLAGEHPFASRTQAAQLMAAQLTEMPKGLGEVRQGIPASLSALVMRCVAKLPEERPGDASQVLAAIESATSDVASTSGRYAMAAPAAGRSRVVSIAVGLLLLIVGAGAWLMRDTGSPAAVAAGAEAGPSVAVLPFEHQGDSADVYLTEGITDEVRNKLTGLSNLVVIARASSNQYRSTDKTPQVIAEELGVRWLLTGTVQVMGTGADRRVLVRPELVEVMADGRLQSRGGEPFEGPMADMLRAQGEVAGQVVRSMEVAVGGSDRAKLIAVPTRNAEAYDLFLRAAAETDGGLNTSPPAVKRAIQYLEQAVALDSGLVDAWRGLGSSYAILYAGERPAPEYKARARSALTQLERVAPGSIDMLRLRSTISRFIEGNIEASYRDVLAAQRLAPEDPRLLAQLATRESALGRFDEALRNYDVVIRRDPRVAGSHVVRTAVLLRLRRHEEARASGARARALAPTALNVISIQLNTELAAGDLEGARRLIAAATEEVPRDQLLANVSLYDDRWWMLDDSDKARLLELPASAFDDTSGFHSVRAEVLHHRGELIRARAHADSALLLLRQALRDAPEDAQSHVLRGLMLALTGRTADAIAAAERGLAISNAVPGSGQSTEHAYFNYVAARTAAIIGDRERAVEWLRACLATRPAYTPAYMRLVPAFAPLLGDPAFEKMLAEAP